MGISLIALSACNQASPSRSNPQRAYLPLAESVKSELAAKGMSQNDPILVRIFKEESELEVWKKSGGSYKLFKTYPICKWSGELGPKIRQGDRQAPEGFYTITPAQMNPNSSYYLSFNLGFPNNYDRSYGRTGQHLMVHGDCSSMGCYAMTDPAIAEVYALAREAFAGGQPSFQVQAMPFRMTPKNLARHRSNPNMAFWRNLKEGNDHFMVSQIEPKVDVCERRYVFNSVSGGLSASGSCATYRASDNIAAAVREKDAADMQQVASLTGSTPLAPVKTGLDGGKHTKFGGISLADYNPPPEAAEPAPAPVVVVAKPARTLATKPASSPISVAAVPEAQPQTIPGTMAYASQPQSFAARMNPVNWFAQPQKVEAPLVLPQGTPLPAARKDTTKQARVKQAGASQAE